VLEDERSANIPDKLKTMLGYIRKVVQHPAQLTADDARALKQAGLSRQEVVDALQVVYLFSIYNRMSDALNFDVPSEANFRTLGSFLLRIGYR
jgi:alkylhydroperoxidase family enzyme